MGGIGGAVGCVVRRRIGLVAFALVGELDLHLRFASAVLSISIVDFFGQAV